MTFQSGASRCNLALSLLLAVSAVLRLAAAPVNPRPLQIFILAGQSNMEGQSVVDLEGPDYNDGQGTLARLMKDPAKGFALRHLRDNQGRWTVRNDVWVRYQLDSGKLLQGRLSVGFSGYGDLHHFGPELQFGHRVGDAIDAPVLLIKTAWGGKSLHTDFRPPSAGGQVGPSYTRMIAEVRGALARLTTDFPEFTGLKPGLAGFVWYQGWNDGVDPIHAVPAYEFNLACLIRDVRKEFEVSDLPVVIGELTGPWKEAPPEWTALRRAQARVAGRKEFLGTVAFAPTAEFVRPAQESPNTGHGHHEFGNAETGFLVGDALGQAMLGLLKLQQKSNGPATPTPPPATDLSDRSGVRFEPIRRDIEGWAVEIDPSLIEGQHQPAGNRALTMLANHLQRIRILVSPVPLAQMQKVGIWIERDHPRLHSMQYHPSRDWLLANRHDPRLTRKVHITQAAELLSREQMLKHPAVILHELAHGYHDQVLGFDDASIRLAYEAAKKAGIYERVLLYTGEKVRHYGLTTPQEYFAEGTEAYFYRNDFYPFVRAELKEHDPVLHALLEKVWGSASH